MPLLEQEEKSRAARRRSVSFITGIVARFFEETPEKEPAEKRGIFPNLFSRILAPKKKTTAKGVLKQAETLPPPIASDFMEEGALPMSDTAEAEVTAIITLMENADIGASAAPAEPQENQEKKEI